MRTLLEIIDSAKDGQMPSHEECYYAMLALSALHYFDHHALSELDKDHRQAWWINLQINESFGRFKNALDKSPKDWIGWNEDPANPEYQKRRNIGKKLVNKVLGESSI